jgi:cobalt-zinc-cadmium efflux system outer membrane protein
MRSFMTRAGFRRPAAGALFGLLAATVPAQAGLLSEERAAVGSLLRERGQAALSASLPQSHASEDAEVGRLLNQPLTVETAVRLALLNHRGVRAALVALGIPRGQLTQDSLPPNPEVEVSLRRPHDSVQPLQAEIGVDYELSALVLLPLRRSAAKSELSAARQRAASDVLDVAYRARLAFYEAAARSEQLALRQRAQKIAEAAYAVREELARAGNVPALDLHQERAAMETARLAVTEAEQLLREARERMNAALGLQGKQTAWSIAKDALSVPAGSTVDDAEQRAIEANLELAALRSQATGAEQRAHIHRAAGVLPHLGAGFHGEHDGTSWELGGHVSLSLPIFNQGQGRVAAARAEAGSLRERVAAEETALRARVRTVQARLSLSLSRARILREGVLPAREMAFRETQLQYNGMQVSVFQLLDARRLLFDAQAAHVDALREAQEARAALDLLLAGHHPERVGGASRLGMTASAASGAAH